MKYALHVVVTGEFTVEVETDGIVKENGATGMNISFVEKPRLGVYPCAFVKGDAGEQDAPDDLRNSMVNATIHMGLSTIVDILKESVVSKGGALEFAGTSVMGALA